MARRTEAELLIEPIGADLVTFAQCTALDATSFPHPSIPSLLASPGAAPEVFVARVSRGGAVVGFVVGRRQRGMLAILGLAVDVAHRRSGVGRALLRAVLARAKARRVSAFLHVSTANRGAIALYEREGFDVVRRIAGFYSPQRFPEGGAAYEMVWALPY